MVLPSQRLVDFNVECEVSGRAYYERRLARPEWPGGASGVTEGIGYDLGYTDEVKLQRDWVPVINDVAMISAMRTCIGVHGQSAHALLPKVRNSILVPWDQAMQVFLERDVPEYTDGVCRAIPGADKLPPDCLGVLFSIAYNRGNGGWKAQGDRFLEMREIRAAIIAGNLAQVGPLIRGMTRHWPSNDSSSPDRGLRARRMKEADLWDAGLKKLPEAAPIKHVVNDAPPKTLPPPPAGAKEHGSATGGVITTAGAANDAANSGMSSTTVIMIVVGGVILSAFVWYAVRKYRAWQNPTLANVKERPPESPPVETQPVAA